jgi:hypothetical protein
MLTTEIIVLNPNGLIARIMHVPCARMLAAEHQNRAVDRALVKLANMGYVFKASTHLFL